MNLYKEHTNRELLSVFEERQALTYEAQIQLKDEILYRKLALDVKDLNNTIAEKSEAIKNLEYLKDLGYKSTGLEDTVRIIRMTKASILDIVAIVLGVVLSYFGLVRFIKIIFGFVGDAPFDLMAFLSDGAVVVIGYIGFNMLSGFKRLIDHMGFELLSEKGFVRLKKRFDLTLETKEFKPEEVAIEINGGEIVLSLGNVPVITGSSDNLIQRMTIEELALRIKNNEEVQEDEQEEA
ncbi:hypothetical protein [uncultured Dokdonia sp.]|uniref:hypothetical protein n=1 Tax=uncultured Dokdonia sp. TaxID=575653 RepID=UPI00260E5C46|nr:hypothetical protein [uncultured Dokdonia sp.]